MGKDRKGTEKDHGLDFVEDELKVGSMKLQRQISYGLKFSPTDRQVSYLLIKI